MERGRGIPSNDKKGPSLASRRGYPVRGIAAVASTAYAAVPSIGIGLRARPTHRKAHVERLLHGVLLRKGSNIGAAHRYDFRTFFGGRTYVGK